MSESPDKTTYAQRRREAARAGLRLKLRAGQFVRRLLEIADQADSAEPAKVPALKLKADIYARLLAKCLPDLKAIEHMGEIKHRDVSDQPLTASQWQEQYGRDRLETASRSPESVN